MPVTCLSMLVCRTCTAMYVWGLGASSPGIIQVSFASLHHWGGNTDLDFVFLVNSIGN